MMTFFYATALFMFITWGMFLFYLFTKKMKRSTVYGYLALSYIAHALSSQMLNFPWMFYFIFSIIFLLIFSINKKIENKLLENDINEKEKDSNEL